MQTTPFLLVIDLVILVTATLGKQAFFKAQLATLGQFGESQDWGNKHIPQNPVIQAIPKATEVETPTGSPRHGLGSVGEIGPFFGGWGRGGGGGIA